MARLPSHHQTACKPHAIDRFNRKSSQSRKWVAGSGMNQFRWIALYVQLCVERHCAAWHGTNWLSAVAPGAGDPLLPLHAEESDVVRNAFV